VVSLEVRTKQDEQDITKIKHINLKQNVTQQPDDAVLENGLIFSQNYIPYTNFLILRFNNLLVMLRC